MLEYNNLKRIAEKLELERDADKKRLIEMTDHQFEVNILYCNTKLGLISCRYAELFVETFNSFVSKDVCINVFVNSYLSSKF